MNAEERNLWGVRESPSVAADDHPLSDGTESGDASILDVQGMLERKNDFKQDFRLTFIRST